MPVRRKLGEAVVARPARHAFLRIRDFLALVDHGVRERMGPRAYRSWETRQRFGYVQYWKGEHWLHYECWVQRKTQRLEIGLHFEGDRDRSYAAAGLLAEHAIEVAAAAGPEYELEEWTPTWARLHRAFPAPSLTEDLAADAAARVVALIHGMEPLLAKVGLR
ncbi:MAG: hypothetical protein HY873_05380 [Chloroflexi bacterium]|nr:hypothetical protein [Chloroflexota bacterium]